MRPFARWGTILALCLAIAAPAASEPMSYPIGTRGLALDFTTAVPIAQIDTRTGDMSAFVTFGGGLTLFWVDKNDPEKTKIVSLNAMLAPITGKDENPKLLVMIDLGAWNDQIRIGFGWRCERPVKDENRLVGLVSIGTNFFEKAEKHE